MHQRLRSLRLSSTITAGLMVMIGLLLMMPLTAQESTFGQSEIQTSEITNPTCPVTVGEEIDPEQWIEYQGKRVYFCCETCKRKFKRNPDAYLANLPQFAETSSDSAMEGHNDQDQHDHATTMASTASETHEHSEKADGPEHGASDEHGEEEAQHDHNAHEGSGKSGLAKLISWLGKSHPPSVHFPIALLMSAAFAELLVMVTGRSLFESAARFCVWIGSVSTLGAVTLGWFFAGFRLSDPDWIMTVHRWLGTAVGGLAIIILFLCIAAYRPGPQQKQWKLWYRIALFIGAAAVSANGFFGGALVYGLNHYAW